MEKVILTMSTVPYRLIESRAGMGIKPVLDVLLNMTYPNYELHLNVPIRSKTGEYYRFPDWMNDIDDPKFIIRRCEDHGAITKILPTLKAIEDPGQVVITVDDDLLYEKDLIEHHLLKRAEHPECAIGFDGLHDMAGTMFYCSSVEHDTEVRILQGYKTVSFERGWFEEDFFTEFAISTWNDDVALSAYMGKQGKKKIVCNHPSIIEFTPRVQSYPVINHVGNERGGCSIFRDFNLDDKQGHFRQLGYL